MTYFHSLKSGTAALLALISIGGAAVPLVTTTSAFAQYPYQRAQQFNNVVLPSGTSIPVQYDKEKIIVMPDETAPLTLTVARNITANNGTLLVPAGSKISGELKPVSGGTQFVAKELTLYRPRLREQTRAFPIDGSSKVVRRIEEVKKGASTGSILQGAAIGGAAAAALSALIGDRAIATEEVLGGAGLGALGGLFLNRKKVDAVVIYPQQDLTVRLNSQFSLR
jgi:hypothetical protein